MHSYESLFYVSDRQVSLQPLLFECMHVFTVRDAYKVFEFIIFLSVFTEFCVLWDRHREY